MKKVTIILLLLAPLMTQAQEDVKAVFSKGVMNLKAEKFKAAESNFSKVLQEAVNVEGRKMAFIYRSFARDGQENYQGAIADLDSAIVLDPHDLATYFDRMKTLLKMGNYDAVIQDCKLIRSKEPNSEQLAMTEYFLGRGRFGKGKYQQSIEHLSKSLLAVPDDFEALFFRASAYERTMQIEEAIADYGTIIGLYPNYAPAYANRGVMKINLLTARGNIQPKKRETKSACEDLLKAKALGDNSVDDMLEVYCK